MYCRCEHWCKKGERKGANEIIGQAVAYQKRYIAQQMLERELYAPLLLWCSSHNSRNRKK